MSEVCPHLVPASKYCRLCWLIKNNPKAAAVLRGSCRFLWRRRRDASGAVLTRLCHGG